MKITRKRFIRQTLASLIALSFIPKIMWSRSVTGSPSKNPHATTHPKATNPGQSITLPTTRLLGNTGMEVTPLGFGASRTQEPAVLKAALDQGINFLDTGRSYANGQNEAMIGKTLKGIRQQYIIQSKLKIDWNKGKATPAELRKQMESSLEKSLKALQTDYIDIMLLHGIREKEILQNETIRRVFTEMKQRGAIRACGFSSHINHLDVLREANNDHFFDVAMVPFNPFGGFKHSQSGWTTSWNQKGLIKEMKKARTNGTGIIAMKTCSGGTHPSRPQEKPSYSGAVKWVLSHDFVDTSAVAMASFQQIREHTIKD
ncbi:MAG TPA: aldo/keto reductase [Bacteroidales bacterium]|nr:aldo/keto reductase [Bacteroidales bacterium]